MDRRRLLAASAATACFALARHPAFGVTLQSPTLMDEIVAIVTDVEGYIDAPLHARFREVAAAGGNDAEAEVRRYAAGYGDLTSAGAIGRRYGNRRCAPSRRSKSCGSRRWSR